VKIQDTLSILDFLKSLNSSVNSFPPCTPEGNRIKWRDRVKFKSQVWPCKGCVPLGKCLNLTELQFSQLYGRENSLSLNEDIKEMKGNITYLEVPTTLLGNKYLLFYRTAELDSSPGARLPGVVIPLLSLINRMTVGKLLNLSAPQVPHM